mgnify:FL=1
MKLSDRTIRILTNMSKINRSIKFKEGNELSSLSIQKNVLAKTTIEETFPQDFAIYDLDEFLKVMSLTDNQGDLTFGNTSYVTINTDRTKAKYFFADPSIVISPPEKFPTLPSIECEFDLNISDLNKIRTALSIYGHLEDIAIVGKDGTITVEIKDRENPSSNTYSIGVGSTDATFSFELKSENIYKLDYSNANTGYNVKISKSGVSQWVSSDGVEYLIALEPDSSYEEN